MTATRKQFGTALATNFLNEIRYQRNNYYYFLGKLEPWENSDSPESPFEPLSYSEDTKIRNNSAYFKKITPNDVSLVTKRNYWVSGEVYEQWDDTRDMDELPFYVLTPDNRIYKCLNNNSNGISTVMPTSNALSAFKTSDGYTWKYMYTIPGHKLSRFTSVNYIPVQKALSEGFYNQGSIESVSIIEPGTGYFETQKTNIIVNGTTTGSGAVLSFTVNPSGGIATVSVINGGNEYTKGCKLLVTSSTGSGAMLQPNISSGVITAVTIVDSGVGYLSTNSIQVIVGGAIIIPKVSSLGSILGVTIIDEGIGYVSAPILNITTDIYTNVDGLYDGNSSAILEAIEDGGSIKQVLIRDPGIGYSALDTTTIVADGDGFGFYAIPVIYNGEIVDVLIENAGVGYTNLKLSVDSPIGYGATFRPIYSSSETVSDQSIVEQMGNDGAIYSIVVTESGTGYTPTTTVSIVGDGSGATAHAVLSGSTIEKIVVDSWGTGYTTAKIVINDPNRITLFVPLVEAKAYAILPPIGGHGTDAVKELYAKTMLIVSTIRLDSALTDFEQDYRQFGILSQPRNMITNKTSTVDFDYNVYKTTFENVTDLTVDSVLVLNNHYRFRVVDIESDFVFLQPLFRGFIEPIGLLKVEGNYVNEYSSTGVLSRPIINKYSGNLMYVANEEPFEFSDTQGLVIKTYISF